MSNNCGISTSISTAPHEWRRQFHHGWVDAQNGGRWSKDYERMGHNEQLGYEQGRLLAREAISAGFPLCIWRGDKADARKIDRLWSEVSVKIGHGIIPGDWRAPRSA